MMKVTKLVTMTPNTRRAHGFGDAVERLAQGLRRQIAGGRAGARPDVPHRKRAEDREDEREREEKGRVRWGSSPALLDLEVVPCALELLMHFLLRFGKLLFVARIRGLVRERHLEVALGAGPSTRVELRHACREELAAFEANRSARSCSLRAAALLSASTVPIDGFFAPLGPLISARPPVPLAGVARRPPRSPFAEVVDAEFERRVGEMKGGLGDTCGSLDRTRA